MIAVTPMPQIRHHGLRKISIIHTRLKLTDTKGKYNLSFALSFVGTRFRTLHFRLITIIQYRPPVPLRHKAWLFNKTYFRLREFRLKNITLQTAFKWIWTLMLPSDRIIIFTDHQNFSFISNKPSITPTLLNWDVQSPNLKSPWKVFYKKY